MAMGSGAGSQVTEAEMLAAVSAICDRLDPPVVWLHLADSRRAGGPYRKGLPDLFLVGRHRSAWRELKAGTSEHGGQRAWRYLLTLSGQDAGVWRRADLRSGPIASELAVLNRPRPGQPPDTSEAACNATGRKRTSALCAR